MSFLVFNVPNTRTFSAWKAFSFSSHIFYHRLSFIVSANLIILANLLITRLIDRRPMCGQWRDLDCLFIRKNNWIFSKLHKFILTLNLEKNVPLRNPFSKKKIEKIIAFIHKFQNRSKIVQIAVCIKCPLLMFWILLSDLIALLRTSSKQLFTT